MGHFSGYLLSLFLKLFVEIIAYEILAVCAYARRSHTHTLTHTHLSSPPSCSTIMSCLVFGRLSDR